MFIKRLSSILILLFVCVTAVFADTGNIQFRYKLNKYVAEYVELGFTDTSKKTISTYELDLTKKLDHTQVYLSISTNKSIGSNYAITLKFFPMTNDDPFDLNFVGCYKVMVFDTDYAAIGTGSSDSTLQVNNTEGNSITFDGPGVADSNKTSSFYYPITFDFSEYIDEYAAGSFSGTIVVEVAT